MKERISALMDGELEGRAADEAIESLRGEGEALESWRMYHLISDGMRDTRLLSAGFTARVSQRLAEEATVLAPGRLPGRTPAQRIAYTGAAIAAAIGLVSWLAFGPQPEVPKATIAVAPQAATPVTVQLTSSANDYLLAHQGFSPRVSLQGMVPYVRTVSERGESGK
ncbi:MAG: sigma-E factor negative regulatory protein [Betaproteobacteria bacterium]|nr:sigma-E factor negative regulatory protein [Betaproteobacteria bacterium]MBV9360057.1 sigma-E factor negative regulatory protein [Betaproteobacteria bacterium]